MYINYNESKDYCDLCCAIITNKEPVTTNHLVKPPLYKQGDLTETSSFLHGNSFSYSEIESKKANNRILEERRTHSFSM